jgi:hypothetical protein
MLEGLYSLYIMGYPWTDVEKERNWPSVISDVDGEWDELSEGRQKKSEKSLSFGRSCFNHAPFWWFPFYSYRRVGVYYVHLGSLSSFHSIGEAVHSSTTLYKKKYKGWLTICYINSSGWNMRMEQKHRIRAGHVRFLPSSPPPPVTIQYTDVVCVVCVCKCAFLIRPSSSLYLYFITLVRFV